jgi:hypothetical protein
MLDNHEEYKTINILFIFGVGPSRKGPHLVFSDRSPRLPRSGALRFASGPETKRRRRRWRNDIRKRLTHVGFENSWFAENIWECNALHPFTSYIYNYIYILHIYIHITHIYIYNDILQKHLYTSLAYRNLNVSLTNHVAFLRLVSSIGIQGSRDPGIHHRPWMFSGTSFAKGRMKSWG